MIIVGVVVAVKVAFLLAFVPTMTVWLDEMFNYSTAFDLAHPGGVGVPHPQFLFYPPLTAMVTAPIHLLGLPAPWPYQLSLVVLALALATAVMAALLLVRELGGTVSGSAAAVFVLASPSTSGLQLMSEPLFITTLVWHLFLAARLVRTGRWGAAVGAGLTAGLVVLARPNGIGVIGAVGALAIVDLLATRAPGRSARAVRYAVCLAIPVATLVAWSAIADRIADQTNWSLSALGYLKAFWAAREAPGFAVGFTRRILANLCYPVLATFGLPIASVLVLAPGGSSQEARRRVWAALLAGLTALVLFTAVAAAVHMQVYGARSPLPRYLLFGRYLEGFTLPGLALFVAALDRLSDPLVRRRAMILVPSALLASLASVPPAFFAKLIRQCGVHVLPNQPGLGWIAWLFQGVGWPGLAVVVPILGCFLLVGLTSRRARTVGSLGLVVLLTGNALLAAREAALHSAEFSEIRSVLSSSLSSRPEAEIYFGFNRWFDQGRPTQQAMLIAYVDHLDRARALGDGLRSALGRSLVVTTEQADGYEVLYGRSDNERSGALRVYGLGRVGPRPPDIRLVASLESKLALELDPAKVHVDSIAIEGRGPPPTLEIGAGLPIKSRLERLDADRYRLWIDGSGQGGLPIGGLGRLVGVDGWSGRLVAGTARTELGQELPVLLTVELFRDGFETGRLTGWSSHGLFGRVVGLELELRGGVTDRSSQDPTRASRGHHQN